MVLEFIFIHFGPGFPVKININGQVSQYGFMQSFIITGCYMIIHHILDQVIKHIKDVST